MVYLFMALCCVAMVLYVWITRVYRGAGNLKKPIVRLLCVATYTVILQGIFVLCTDYKLATVVIALYFAGIDWLLVEMLLYAEAYTQLFIGRVGLKRVIKLIAVLDTVNIMLNLRYEHVFLLYRRVFSNGYVGWGVGRATLSFNAHLLFSYLLVLGCLAILTIKAVKTPVFYRTKYLTVLGMLITVVIVNGVCMVFESPYDISVFLYCVIAIQISHYSLFYKPKELINKTLALVVNDINDAVFCFDHNEKCVYTNKMVAEYFGESTRLDEINSAFGEKIREYSMRDQEAAQYEVELELEGEQRIFAVNYNKLVDKHNSYIGCFFTLRDRTEEIEKFKEEHHRITRDQLTGVFNRQYFFAAAEKLIAENPNTDYMMVCSDIRGFKLFNDLFGQDKGDEMLVLLANLVKQHASDKSVYGRISADEFAAILPRERYQEELFLRMLGKIRDQFSNNQYQVHINVGVYEIIDRTEPISVMCDKAKLAIEEHRGDYSHNAVVSYYDKKLMERSLYERMIVGEFDRALENNEFCMYLQPQITADGTLLGAEALVRWQHPERGLVSPAEFIEVFERTGLIYRLDRYMWELAAKQLKKWKESGREELYISVNISAMDFYYTDIYEDLAKLITKYELKPENLKLEITETVMMKEMKNQTSVLNHLRDSGFRIEIDDFGSGYSSLNMLKNIEVDIVKIDMCFLEQSNQEERGTAILSSIIALIKKLGMGVITEGVETREQVENLKEMGCHMFQGYFFDKPMTVEQFEEKYKKEVN